MNEDWQLDDDEDSDRLPDPPLTPQQREHADQLGKDDLRQIDAAILSNVRADFSRKVAMVIGLTMNRTQEKHRSLPDVFYAERVKRLADEGFFEVFGDLNRMRYSEIRLKSSKG
jgi:hypothetical protein